jgi:hypothetical protein
VLASWPPSTPRERDSFPLPALPTSRGPTWAPQPSDCSIIAQKFTRRQSRKPGRTRSGKGPVNPIPLLVLVAALNGVAAAPFLLIVMLISNDKEIMGDYINGKLARTLGWATTALMTAAAVILFAFAHGGGLY